MSAQKLIGFSMFAAAAVYGFRAAQKYKNQGGEVMIVDAPEPVNPNAYAMPGQIDLSWMKGMFKGWPSFIPDAVAAPAAPANRPAIGTAYSYEELILARTIFGEAGRETRAGKEAVANVVLNRVRDRRWPSRISKVCLQPWQFSCWNKGDPMYRRIKDLQPGSSMNFDECLHVARAAVSGRLRDNTGGADHYYANYIKKPKWAKGNKATFTLAHGVHQFYKVKW